MSYHPVGTYVNRINSRMTFKVNMINILEVLTYLEALIKILIEMKIVTMC